MTAQVTISNLFLNAKLRDEKLAMAELERIFEQSSFHESFCPMTLNRISKLLSFPFNSDIMSAKFLNEPV